MQLYLLLTNTYECNENKFVILEKRKKITENSFYLYVSFYASRFYKYLITKKRLYQRKREIDR